MAYIPPLNGGRVNATISGNTAGAGSLVSSGTLTLAGGNNITLSQAGNAITISGANAPSGSINFSASNTSANLASLAFSNSNGVSFGLNGSTLTASVAPGGVAVAGGGATYSSGTANLIASGAMTITSINASSLNFSVPQTSSLQATGVVSISTNGGTISIGAPAYSAGISNGVGNTSGTTGFATNQLVLAGGNNVTLSQATGAGGNTLSISAASQSAQTQNIIQGLVGGTATSTASTGTVTFANSNGVTFGMSGNTMTASVAAGGGGGGGIALYDGVNNITSGTVSLMDANGVSLGINGQTLTGSVAAQTNQTLGMTFLGNTTQNTTATVDARSLSFNGLGGVSVGYSNGSVQISGAAGGGGGGIALAGGGAGSSATVTNGTASLSVTGGAMTISGTGSTFNFSVPAISSLSATGMVGLSYNGNTVSIGAPAYPGMGMMGTAAGGSTNGTSGSNTNGLFLYAGSNITMSQSTNATGASVTVQGASGGGGGGGATLSRWEYPNQVFTTVGAPINSSMSLQHIIVPFNVTAQSMRVAAAFTVANITAATTASVNLSLQLGIYTLNASTLQSVSTASANNGFSWSASAQSSQFNSLRQITVPMNVNMTAGEYWIGAILNSASTYSGVTLSMYGNNQIGATGAIGNLGSNITASARDVLFGQGLYATAALPSTVALSAITNSGTQAMRAAIYHVLYNATY